MQGRPTNTTRDLETTPAFPSGVRPARLISLDLHAVDAMERTSASEWLRAGFHGCEWFASENNPMSLLEQAEACCRCAQPFPNFLHAVSVRLTPEELTKAVESLRYILPRLSDCGVRVMILEPWPLSPSAGARGFDGYPSLYNRVHDLLKEIRFDSEAWGIRIAICALHGGFPCSPVELRELIDTANSWTIGACVDTLTMHSLAQAHDWVQTLGRRALAIRGNFMPLTADWSAEMKAETFRFHEWEPCLKSIRFDGVLIHRAVPPK